MGTCCLTMINIIVDLSVQHADGCNGVKSMYFQLKTFLMSRTVLVFIWRTLNY